MIIIIMKEHLILDAYVVNIPCRNHKKSLCKKTRTKGAF